MGVGTERFIKKCKFSMQVFSYCALNFDATNLPLLEPLYPKFFRGTPKVNLASTIWLLFRPKSGKGVLCHPQIGHLKGFFLGKINFLGKTNDFRRYQVIDSQQAIHLSIKIGFLDHFQPFLWSVWILMANLRPCHLTKYTKIKSQRKSPRLIQNS